MAITDNGTNTTVNNGPAAQQRVADNGIDIKDLLFLCLAKWKWFVVSLVITLSFACFYLLTTPPVYQQSASLLIKEDAKGQSIGSDVASVFSELGFSQGQTNVNNELIALQSPELLYEVGRRLSLDVNYQVKGRFHKNTLYGETLPVKVIFHELDDNESAKMVLSLLPGEKVNLSGFERRGEKIAAKDVEGNLNELISTPLGQITVVKGTAYDDFIAESNPAIYVSRSGYHGMTRGIQGGFTAVLSDKKATVINLTYKDLLIPRANDVLNTIIAVYRENWIKDKNQITNSTSMFINDRLGVIEQELGDVDQNISSFKSEHLLPDVEAASNLYMTQSKEMNNKMLELNTKLSMARYIKNFLRANAEKNQLLPASPGLESSSIEEQIAEYNKVQLQRNNLVTNSSEQNPLVLDYDQSLSAMRNAIVTSIDNFITTINTQLESVEKTEKKTTAQIAANPNQARYLLSVGRQQKVKEALYLFLLQKREENELSQAFTAYNTRVITPPTGTFIPIAPKKNMIVLVAFMLGLAIPGGIIFLRESMNTKVRGKKDLENLNIPFLGEIPLDTRDGKRGIFKRMKRGKAESFKMIVVEGSRDIMNEAFRVLRTNLEFMTGGDDKSKVFVITSFNPGSGKSLLSLNIAGSLAIKGKRVLVIDGDLRHASVSQYLKSPKTGLSNYLSGKESDYKDLIVPDKNFGNLYVLPVGVIPPNPTELLFSDRLKTMLQELRNSYDYIFFDCPPVEIVADTQIIEKFADRTIFVIRVGVMDRTMLNELKNMYSEKKFKNMSVILNGTEGAGGKYYSYRYGYRYGYNYGYGYSYHYGGNDDKNNG